MSSVARFLLPAWFLLAGVALGQPAPVPAGQSADHEQLRALLRTATDALNRRDFAALAPMFSDHCDITTVDGRSFTTLAAFKSYVDDLYATRIAKIEFHPVADALTTFLDADTGVCVGSSTDTYTFRNGDSRTMTSRWTATVHRQNGQWKVAALHMSANILDNPVLDATKKTARLATGGAAVIGVIAGYIIRMLVKR